MAKFTADVVLDAFLNYIADNGDELYLCSAQPTTYAQASSTYALAEVLAMTTGAGGADYDAIVDDATSGRKLVLSAQTGITVDTTNTATHFAICKNSGSVLLHVGTLTTSQAVVELTTVDFPAIPISINDPT